MFMPSHRLDVAGVRTWNSPAAPFTSFHALFSCLQDLGSEGRAGSGYWGNALRTAALARQAESSDALISAALLHHLGAMVWFASASPGTKIAPCKLAHFGADLLADLYAPPVTEPIRMQASVQRYLAGSKSYALRQLLLARKSHGTVDVDPMSEPERECFATMPFASDAIRLCRWSLAAAGAAHLDCSVMSLRRIAARSVGNEAFGWETSGRAHENDVADAVE